MCFGQVKAPEPIKVEKPVFVRNPFLDNPDGSGADSMRTGRSSLVIPSGTGIGFEGQGGVGGTGAGGGLAIGPASGSPGERINSAGITGGVGPAGGTGGPGSIPEEEQENRRQRQRDGRSRGGGPSRS